MTNQARSDHDMRPMARKAGRPLRRRGRYAFAILVGLAAFIPGLPLPALGADSAVIVMYHRFGEPRYPATNVTLEQFEQHIEELRTGGYTVLPVPEIIDALRTGKPLAEKTVGLTIDDAYLSVYAQAWPRLKEAGLPFTLFIATDPVDRGLAGFMNWDQIRELAQGGVTIGSQTASHLHMARESTARNQEDLQRSNRRFLEELEAVPSLFAYPYGEASLAVEDVVREAGFATAFGQHSGAFGSTDNFFYLPRFAINQAYGDLARFRLAAGSLALPVTDVTPADHLVTDNNPPAMGFTVKGITKGLGRITCYLSGVGRVRVERLGDARIEIRADNPFAPGRTRLNCTLPGENGRWRWAGRQFYVPPSSQ